MHFKKPKETAKIVCPTKTIFKIKTTKKKKIVREVENAVRKRPGRKPIAHSNDTVQQNIDQAKASILKY